MTNAGQGGFTVVHSWRKHLSLFDKTGLSRERVRLLYVIMYAVTGATIWGNITTGSIYTAFVQDLDISDTIFGLLIAVQNALTLLQIYASRHMEKTRCRTKMFLVSAMIQRAIWIPIGLLPLIIPESLATLRNAAVIGMIVLAASTVPFINVSWNSIMVDVVPIRIRGRFLSVRTSLATAIALGIGLLAGAILAWIPGYRGYFVVFLIAGIFGVADISCYLFMKLPDMKPVEKQTIPKRRVFGRIYQDKPFLKVLLMTSGILFASNLALPYRTVYAYNNLHMNTLQLMLYGNTVSNIMIIISGPFWGRAIDRYGSLKITCVVQLINALTGLLWLNLRAQANWIFGLASALDALFNLTPLTVTRYALVMDWRDDETGSLYYAIYCAVTALIGVAAGSQIGGLLLDNVLYRMDSWGLSFLSISWNRYTGLFALSQFLLLALSVAYAAVVPQSIRHMKDKRCNEAGQLFPERS